VDEQSRGFHAKDAVSAAGAWDGIKAWSAPLF